MHIKMYKSITIINKCVTTDELCTLFYIKYYIKRGTKIVKKVLLSIDLVHEVLHFNTKGK